MSSYGIEVVNDLLLRIFTSSVELLKLWSNKPLLDMASLQLRQLNEASALDRSVMEAFFSLLNIASTLERAMSVVSSSVALTTLRSL